MNQIHLQVNRAHRRMLLIQFAKRLCLSLGIGLSLAVIGLGVPKFWHLPFLESPSRQQLWLLSWPLGGILWGCLLAIIWTWVRRNRQLDSAIEVDRRFELKERLSTALALTEEERQSEAGQALIRDANERAELIDVRDQFRWQPNRLLLLPVIPAVLLAVMFLLPDASASAVAASAEGDSEEIKIALEQPRKKIEQKAKELEAKGLKDAADILNSIQKKIDNLSSKTKSDRKQALIELNNAKKQIADRQQKIGGDSKEMKQKLNQLKRIVDGPARKLSESINEGDFKEAQKAIRDLVNDLKNGKLSESEKRKMARDLAKIAEELQKMAERHQQEKQELQERIQKAMQDGDLEKAAQLQQQLEKKQQQDQQIEKMKETANKLQKCSDCMKPGNGQPKRGGGQSKSGQPGNQPSDAQMKEALESLEDLEGMMEQLDSEMQELQDLEDVMQDLENAKNACNGCQGNQDGQPRRIDFAQGGGRGAGLRDKQETETGMFESKVQGKLQPGETVVTGSADGRNLSGQSMSELRETIQASMNKQVAPVSLDKLPRSQREHARQYFNKLGGN